jgi:hypothetical protein
LIKFHLFIIFEIIKIKEIKELTNMKKYFYVCLLTLFFAGCGEKMPEGMPVLVKNAAITVIQDGKPLPDAKVILILRDGNSQWTVGGQTDVSGVAKLVTHGQYSGAPAGKYKVIVSKREEPVSKYKEPQPGQSPEEFQALRNSEKLTAYHLVDPAYNAASSTPASVEISENAPKASIDVGKAVHIEIKETK